MELELQKETFECYRAEAPVSEFHEENAETIVPDYHPDIARIIDAGACLLRRSAGVTDGRLTVAGSIRVTLLYLAEEGTGLRSLGYDIPFEHTLEARFSEGAVVSAVGTICAVEARLLNPRKLATRVGIDWNVSAYRKNTATLCVGVSDREEYAVELLTERQEASLIEAVTQKEFSFTDELSIPGGKDGIRELLSARVTPRVTESRSVGGKVILKGTACVSLLYNGESGGPAAYAEELPFSQILDGIPEEGGETSAMTALSLSGCEVRAAGEDGRTVSVSLQMDAVAVLRRAKTVACVSDLYSTAYELKAVTEPVELSRAPAVRTVQQSVREQLDTGTEVRTVLCAEVCFGSAALQGSALQGTARLKVLYLDEAGVPYTVQRSIELSAETPAEAGAQVRVETVCAGDIAANINSGGIELRFPADFQLVSQDTFTCRSLVSLTAQDAELPELPSLVLRAVKEGERLWDIAKQYRTTVEAILSANDLSEEAELGRMLLIPRKR